MKTLQQIITEAEKNGVAIGHFNIANLEGLKAIFEAGKELNLPVIIGVSEGERDFIGVKQAAALIKSLRDEYGFPIFLNADHTHSLEKVEEAARAGFDAILFDGGKLPLEENIKMTKEAVLRAKAIKPDILIEGEMGYIGASSKILKEIPEGAAIKGKDLTNPKEAERLVSETSVDLFAPAVGNLHGMFSKAANPNLNIERIKEIKKSVKIPLVLHGGSGVTDDDFKAAIKAGVSIVHISTELRLAWRQGLERGLKENPDEIAPYKISPAVIKSIREVVEDRLKLFNG